MSSTYFNKQKVIYALSGAGLILVGYLFVSFIYSDSSKRNEVMLLDAIVVLTGGTGRIEAGASLLSEGRAPVLILSGVNKESDLKSIFFKVNIALDTSRIIIEAGAKSTYENAVEVRKILREKGLKDIILVTSNYHIKRALYIFRKVLPEEVMIYPYPVPSPNFDEKRWWRSATSIRIVTTEFIKFYWCKLQLYLYAFSGPND